MLWHHFQGRPFRFFSNWTSSEESTAESPYENGIILLILTVWQSWELGILLTVRGKHHVSWEVKPWQQLTAGCLDSGNALGWGGRQWQEPLGRVHGGNAWVVPGNPQRYISGEGVFKGDAKRQRTRHPVKNQRCGQCSRGHHARLCQPEKQKMTWRHHPFKGGGTCFSFFPNARGKNCKRGSVSGICEPDYVPFSTPVSTVITYIKIFGIFCESACL